MSVQVGDPAAVLHRDGDGVEVGLHGVVADGLTRDLTIRLPALRRLLEHGEPRHRFEACVVLASWGVREGLLTAGEWARDPDGVPWAGAPVVVDPSGGADAAFAVLLDALARAGRHRTPTAAGSALRTLAVREVLVAYDRVFVGRSMATLLDGDPALAAACRPEITWAITTAARDGRAPFDGAAQAALRSATLDDSTADPLRRETRPVREIGSGPAATVHRWARLLSSLPPTDAAGLVAALGVAGALVPRFGRVVVDPAPPGLAALTVRERDGDVSAVELVLDGDVPRAELDAVLGPGRTLPRVHPGTPEQVGWFVEVLGGTFACAVVASLDGDRAGSVLLRRDRAHRSYPSHHAVDDVPVRLDRSAGRVTARVLDLASGAFVVDDTVLPRLGRRGADVEEIPAGVADRLVRSLRRAASHTRQVTPMTWEPTGDPHRPWRSELGGTTYRIADGDLPVEPRWTLLVGDQEVDHLDAWPTAWRRDV